MAAQPQLLLLVDIQNGFMDNEATKAIIPNVKQIVRLWQQREWPIVCSRFVNLPDSNWERLRDWHKMKGEPETSLIPELTNCTSFVFKKSTYSAWSSEISAVCETQGVRKVVLAGVDTNECVLATALAVFDAGFIPYIVKDCCASSGGDKSHHMAIELMNALLGEKQIMTKDNLYNL